MSKETAAWLNQNVLVGFTDERGTAWHYRKSDQGEESNHYPGAIPVQDVKRRLFHWRPVSVPMGGNIGELLGADRDVWKSYDDGQIVVRSDNFDKLGTFKSGFVIHDYEDWLINKVGAILDDDLSIGSAGLLKNGAQAWVSVEVPDTMTTPEGVEYRPHLLAATSVDGSLSTTYKPVVTLVVCDNTMQAALRENGAVVKIKHSRHSKFKVAEVRDALEIVHKTSEGFAAEVARLTQIKVPDRAWSMFLDNYAPLPEVDPNRKSKGYTLADKKRETLTQLWNNDNRVSPWKGTAFGVHQATNTYAHHLMTVRNVSRPERNMDRALSGDLDALNDETQLALDKALARL